MWAQRARDKFALHASTSSSPPRTLVNAWSRHTSPVGGEACLQSGRANLGATPVCITPALRFAVSAAGTSQAVTRRSFVPDGTTGGTMRAIRVWLGLDCLPASALPQRHWARYGRLFARDGLGTENPVTRRMNPGHFDPATLVAMMLNLAFSHFWSGMNMAHAALSRTASAPSSGALTVPGAGIRRDRSHSARSD